jgi:hypothetical protein
METGHSPRLPGWSQLPCTPVQPACSLGRIVAKSGFFLGPVSGVVIAIGDS